MPIKCGKSLKINCSTSNIFTPRFCLYYSITPQVVYAPTQLTYAGAVAISGCAGKTFIAVLYPSTNVVLTQNGVTMPKTLVSDSDVWVGTITSNSASFAFQNSQGIGHIIVLG